MMHFSVPSNLTQEQAENINNNLSYMAYCHQRALKGKEYAAKLGLDNWQEHEKRYDRELRAEEE